MVLSVPTDMTNRHRMQNNIFLVAGEGIDIELRNVQEGDVSILLARLPINLCCLKRPAVKIDFSTIIEVEDQSDVELEIALRRTCNGNSTILERYELEFDSVEKLPFSFTFVDNQIWPLSECNCVYTVEIIRIEVDGGTMVDELETNSTAINAIIQSC
jgi:hypothetical protein